MNGQGVNRHVMTDDGFIWFMIGLTLLASGLIWAIYRCERDEYGG
jgi:hypothetical protein